MSTPFDILTTPILPGLSIIEASAGTGKTYAISRLVPRLLLDGTAAKLSEILLVTFTKDAARELAERVRSVLEKLQTAPAADEETSDPAIHALRTAFTQSVHDAILARALLDIDQLRVSTIHSFCQEVLETEGTLCGLPVIPEVITDAKEIIDTALYDLWKTEIAGDSFLAQIAAVQQWSLNADLAVVQLALDAENAEIQPPPRPLKEVLKELKDAPASTFTSVMIQELTQFIQKVPEKSWNKAAGDPAARSEMLANLSNTFDFFPWLQAVSWVGNLGTSECKFISGRGAANQALGKEATELKAVPEAKRILALYHALSWHWQHHCAAIVREKISEGLRHNRQITFDGQITTLRDALRSPVTGPQLIARLQKQYKVVLIDESQDTDPRQFEIFSTAFKTSRMVLIGDPKQAIYEFRGADVNTYLEAKKQAGGQVFSLSKTFRSPEGLVKAVNALFQHPNSLLKKGLDFTSSESGIVGDIFLQEKGDSHSKTRIECWIAPDDQSKDYSNGGNRLPLIANAVASEITRLLQSEACIVREVDGTQKSEAVKPGDFAVLVSAGYQADAMLSALHARNIPAIQAKAADVMASEEAADLLILLRAVVEPRRSEIRYAALATRLLGKTAAEIQRIRETATEDDRILNDFLKWQTTLQKRGIAAALQQIDQEEEITLRLAGLAQGERRLTNLRQITDLLQSQSLHLGNRPSHLLRWLAQEIASQAGTAAEERQQQLESDADTVKIVTMHSAKGLEYNLVFCPFLWNAKEVGYGVHKLSRQGETPLLVNLKLADNVAEYTKILTCAALEDRLRLAYVAITRAKVKVWISGGVIPGGAPASALDWLLRADPSLDFSTWMSNFSITPRGTAHTAGINTLHTLCPDGIVQKDPPQASEDKWIPCSANAPTVLTVLSPPSIPAPWGLTSFSSLTREKEPHGSEDALLPSMVQTDANPFSSAPGGPLVGTAVHEWIEQWDFSEPDATFDTQLETHLSKYALADATIKDAKPMHECVAGMLKELRSALLPGMTPSPLPDTLPGFDTCKISLACPKSESSEWHFQLPINAALSPASLAAAFAAHGEANYADILNHLPTEELSGYLHGFLDRLACNNGVWGVIDWKTNKLANGYAQASLKDCAMQSHYFLQAHLYLVALRRFLGSKTPIAGAWLIFLRGVRAGSSDGILHIAPSPALMAALDALFAKPIVSTQKPEFRIQESE